MNYRGISLLWSCRTPSTGQVTKGFVSSHFCPDFISEFRVVSLSLGPARLVFLSSCLIYQLSAIWIFKDRTKKLQNFDITAHLHICTDTESCLYCLVQIVWNIFDNSLLPDILLSVYYTIALASLCCTQRDFSQIMKMENYLWQTWLYFSLLDYFITLGVFGLIKWGTEGCAAADSLPYKDIKSLNVYVVSLPALVKSIFHIPPSAMRCLQ